MDEEEELRIDRIEYGIVLDHIFPGMSLKILEGILKLPKDHSDVISLGMYVETNKCIYGDSIRKKDIIKIENRDIARRELDLIAAISSRTIVSHIKDFKVVDKYQVELPDVLENILECKNRGCVSNKGKNPEELSEPITTKFRVLKDTDPLIIECYYCTHKMTGRSNIIDYLIT